MVPGTSIRWSALLNSSRVTCGTARPINPTGPQKAVTVPVSSAVETKMNAIVNFNKIKEVYELRANLERSAKSYMELAQLQYINGVINYLDVLDAQRGYFDAQIGLSNAIRDELITVVQLYKALGGGWKND